MNSSNNETNIQAEQLVLCRQSKRQHTVPAALIKDYECAPLVVGRLKQTKKKVFATDDTAELSSKYERLEEKLTKHFIVNVHGQATSAKDLNEVANRGRHITGRVADVLVRLLKNVIAIHGGGQYEDVDYIFDSRFPGALARNQVRFYSAKYKQSYVFPKGLNDYINNEENKPRRNCYYFPYNLGKKHWVGVVVDLDGREIIILDTNRSLMSDVCVGKEMKYMADMLPYLLKDKHNEEGDGGQEAFKIERAKGICQNVQVSDTCMMSIILMGVHAMHGMDACYGITGEVVTEESRAAAVMAFELHEEL